MAHFINMPRVFYVNSTLHCKTKTDQKFSLDNNSFLKTPLVLYLHDTISQFGKMEGSSRDESGWLRVCVVDFPG